MQSKTVLIPSIMAKAVKEAVAAALPQTEYREKLIEVMNDCHTTTVVAGDEDVELEDTDWEGEDVYKMRIPLSFGLCPKEEMAEINDGCEHQYYICPHWWCPFTTVIDPSRKELKRCRIRFDKAVKRALKARYPTLKVHINWDGSRGWQGLNVTVSVKKQHRTKTL